MGNKCLNLFWLLLVMGNYKALLLFSNLVSFKAFSLDSQSMGSINANKAFLFTVLRLIVKSSSKLKDFPNKGNIKKCKALLGESPLALYLQGSFGSKSSAPIGIYAILSLWQLHVKLNFSSMKLTPSIITT